MSRVLPWYYIFTESKFIHRLNLIFIVLTLLSFSRCDASNSANPSSPASTRVRFAVFFPPSSLTLEVERPGQGGGSGLAGRKASKVGLDRADTFKKTKKFADQTYKVVMAGELVRIVCIAGKAIFTKYIYFFPLLIGQFRSF